MTRLFLSLIMLFSLACSKDLSLDIDSSISPELPVKISVLTSSSSKGAIVEDPSDMGSIGLYCALTGVEPWSFETEFSKMENQCFTISNGVDWVIDGDPISWGFNSVNDKYSFFAYSPYYDDSQIVTPRIDSGELVIYYSVPTSSVNQPDLMYAEPRKDISPQLAGYVPLTFYHALSCVSFSVVSSTTTTITAIDITGVVSGGTLKWDYTSESPLWSLDELSGDSFSVEVATYTLDDDNSAQLNTEQGYLMMIPQVLGNNAQVTLSLSSGEQRSLTIPANSEWVAGSMYQYVIRLEEDDCDFRFYSNQLSNCYIINPTEGEETTIQIPIEDRINDFWMNYSGDGVNKINDKSETGEFYISIIWEDFDKTLEYSYEIIDDIDKKMAVKLTIPADFQEGNLVFAVVEDDSSSFLWSWHLWLTDYNPDAIAADNRSKIEAGKDKEYTLSGYCGAVHRYADASTASVWSGIYKDKFIMDRNIGERDEFASNYGAGSVYYQFGRKDPFPGSSARLGSGYKSQTTRSSSGFKFYNSVEYARDFFVTGTSSSKNWSDEAAARAATYIWYDDAILAASYTEGKSIFDPSPLGWRVPVSETWSSFDFTDDGQSDCSIPTSVGKYSYYGCRDSQNSAALSLSQSNGFVWSANQSDEQNGVCFSYSDTQANSSDVYYVTYGFPIRAIEE